MRKDIGDLTRKTTDKAIQDISLILKKYASKQEDLSGEFKEDDIRFSAFSKFLKRLTFFYLNLKHFRLQFDNDSELKENFGVVDDKQLQDLFSNHFRFARFDCFVGIFSLFEDAVTLILEYLISPDEMREIAFDVSKILQSPEIKKLIVDNFRECYDELEKKEGFIPLPRKLKKLEDLKLLSKKENEFIDFCGRLRNSMHRNGFYHGKDKKFPDILGVEYEFKDGNLIKFIEIESLIQWIDKLLDIYNNLSVKVVAEHIPDNAIIRS